MIHFNQKGISIVAVLIIVIIAGVIIGGAFMLLNQERTKVRDAKRLADITRIQAAFEFLYNDTASYILASQGGCDQAGTIVSQCNLANYLPGIRSVIDPVSKGSSKYVISSVPNEESFEVTFFLEKSYGNFKAGKHILSPDGIN